MRRSGRDAVARTLSQCGNSIACGEAACCFSKSSRLRGSSRSPQLILIMWCFAQLRAIMLRHAVLGIEAWREVAHGQSADIRVVVL